MSTAGSVQSGTSDAPKKPRKPVLRGPVAQRRGRTFTWRSRESGSFIGNGAGRYDKTSTDLSIGKGLPIYKENTYKLEPDRKFQQEKAETIIAETLREHLTGRTYECARMGQDTRMLSDIIKERVKGLKLERFKIITYVTISEKHKFDMKMVSRCIWDAEFDTYASSTFENPSLTAIGMVFAIYQEWHHMTTCQCWKQTEYRDFNGIIKYDNLNVGSILTKTTTFTSFPFFNQEFV